MFYPAQEGVGFWSCMQQIDGIQKHKAKYCCTMNSACNIILIQSSA